MNIVYPLVAVIVVSLISIVFALPLIIKKRISNRVLVFLLSISVGVLLSTVFLDFLPEAVSHGYTLGVALSILLGYLLMFVLEKLVHWHHSKECETGHHGHTHAYQLAPINLIGDGIHNFIDGLVIAGSFATSTALGITATVSIIFHEIPQEIADMGVLLYSGLHRMKALVFNFLSALTAVLGTVVGIVLAGKLHNFTEFIIPFAAGNFLYIAAANLTPQLHRHCSCKDTVTHIFAILLGIALITLIVLFGPAHGHG